MLDDARAVVIARAYGDGTADMVAEPHSRMDIEESRPIGWGESVRFSSGAAVT